MAATSVMRDINRNVQKRKPAERLSDFIAEKGKINVNYVIDTLHTAGFHLDDPRFVSTAQKLSKAQAKATVLDDNMWLDIKTFLECISETAELIVKAFTADMVIPEFKAFCRQIKEVYNMCKDNNGGAVADYIPQLHRYSPDNWGVCVCTTDGQRFTIGNVDVPFPIESCCKPINYSLALNDMSSEEVHKYIGQEPSGESFNQIKLDGNSKPHNPMINTGAIVCASLLKNKERPADRFEYALGMYKRLAGGQHIGFNNSVFLSERATADRNFALGHYLKENDCFPDGLSLQETMDFYFQLCSIEVTCESAATIAATLANGGYCPLSGDQVVSGDAVRNTLSLMHSCGMYDYSGQFAFNVGLPAKSGVSGIVLLVVPNICGICMWSPPLDEYGNSVRGIQFSEELVRRFNFHEYDKLTAAGTQKFDPHVRQTDVQAQKVTTLHFGASNGDLTAIRRMHMIGQDLGVGDYDGRTALHLAAAEGHLECVHFLIEVGKVHPSPKDRFGQTPLKDAQQFKRTEIIEYLKSKTKE